MSFAFTYSPRENQGQLNFEQVHPSHGWLPGVLVPSRASCGYLVAYLWVDGYHHPVWHHSWHCCPWTTCHKIALISFPKWLETHSLYLLLWGTFCQGKVLLASIRGNVYVLMCYTEQNQNTEKLLSKKFGKSSKAIAYTRNLILLEK